VETSEFSTEITIVNILDRLLGHDAWTTRQLLLRCRELSDAELDREFDIGHRSVRATLLHVIRNMEVWTDLIAGWTVRPNPEAEPSGRSIEGLLRRLDVAAQELAAVASRIVQDGRLDELWLDQLDQPPREKSYGGAIAHVITHSMHHRAQLLYLLRRLGVRDLIEGDVLSWEAQLLQDDAKPTASAPTTTTTEKEALP
jgi:uncharacterized damage-inducible protein DinB